MKMSHFVKLWNEKIKNIQKKNSDSNVSLYVLLEQYITNLETESIISSHKNSESDVAADTLRPFIQFLTNRWERIKGTMADYVIAPDTIANQVSIKLAEAIARNMLSKSNVTADEANQYLINSARPAYDASREEQNQLLKERVVATAVALCKSEEDLIDLMTNVLNPNIWQEFILECDVGSLKDLFMDEAFVKKHGNVYHAIQTLATTPTAYGENTVRNQAKLFCLLELYKRERQHDLDYIGFGGMFTGVQKSRRLSQVTRLQEYITSDVNDFDQFMQGHDKDARTMNSGHMGVLAKQVKVIKTYVPDSMSQRPGLN